MPFCADQDEAAVEALVPQRFHGAQPGERGADDGDGPHRWLLSADSRSDRDFVLDRVEPVVIGAGTSGYGFKLGPELGRALAALALGEDPRVPRARFAIDRPARRPGAGRWAGGR